MHYLGNYKTEWAALFALKSLSGPLGRELGAEAHHYDSEPIPDDDPKYAEGYRFRVIGKTKVERAA